MHVAGFLYPIPHFIRIYLILYCLILFTIDGFGDKLISSSLDANWMHTSLIAEASEFLANDDTNNDKAFWELIDKLSDDNEVKYEETNQENEFGRAMALATPFLSDGTSSVPLLRFALSLRLYSPRVELHRQIARDLLPSLMTSKCPQNESFYQINDRISCKSTEIEQILENTNNGESPAPIYSIDHIFPSSTSSNELPFVIFYADLSKPTTFGKFHKNLKQLANEGRIRYVFRHFDGKDSTSLSNPLPLVSLSGYGVELAIKSTEYKAIDDSNAKNKNEEDGNGAPTNLHGFNFQTLRDKYVHLRDQLRQFQMHLSELDELAPLKQWEIADIGMQASQRVMEVSPEEAIPLLVDLAQNFPIRARSLAQTKVRQSFREEISMNQQQWGQELEIAEGESSIWINGIPVAPDIESLDIFQLFQILRQEQRLAHEFMELGFKREYQSILQIMDLSEEKPGTWALDFRDGKPEWINNLDKDKQYSDWGNSVRLLLQPYFPGMIRPIARNLFTLVCIMDPAASESKNVLKTAFSFYSHNVPLRIGFMFAVNDSASANGLNDLGVALYNIFQFVKTEKSPAKAIHFLQKVYDELGDSLDLNGVHRVFKRHYTDQEIDEVFGSNSDYGSGRQEGMAFYQKSGLHKLPTILLNGVPLEQSTIDSPERFEEGVIVAVMRQTNALQRAVASGKLTDRENVQNWILSQPDVLTRLNARLLGSGGKDANKKEKKIVKMKNRAVLNEKCDAGDEISDEEMGICILKRQRYLIRSDESEKSEEPFWLTIWIVADFDTEKGQKLLQNGLKALKKSNNMRLGIIHNGNEEKEDRRKIPVSMLIDSILYRLSSTAAKQTLNKLFGAIENEKALFDKEGMKEILDKIAGHGVNMEPILTELINGNVRQRLKMQSAFARRVMALAKGQNAMMANGLVYGPLDEDEQFETEDFGLIEKLAERRGAKKVAAFVKEWKKGKMKAEINSSSADLVFGILSAVQNYAIPKRRQTVEIVMEFESVLNLLAEDEGRPVLEITAIIDPLSRAAQKLAPILQILLKVLNADLRLAMNPKQRLSELPIKRFYRYVLREEPAFGPTGHLLENVAQFQDLPQKQLLTMNLIVPDAWMVQPIQAEIDLDNIRVAMASKDIFAKFQLRHILLDGHCFDEQTGNPPRGLQFVLGTKADGAMFDTIVMANLGYFQLKAGPGAWILRLREGKSKEIYELKGSADAERQMEDRGKENEELDELRVLVDSFSGKTIRMRVAKRKGMEKRNLLTEEEGKEEENAFEEEDDGGEESIWSNLAPKKVVKKLSSKILGGEKHEVINVFSLASGHLYERFLRIMMLSVIKNTKHSVKFWLLNNYLSPQFRESLPILAQNYGFDYQLIEYKWPRWLHQQTEKQRVMWGYKILFLDVLFPLDVKKIIFVDADQVVRTDMMELMEYDLKGAPYGYTPFCESRTSMDGFRFWKSGYWASHLAGRKYHISALYVVDLAKFRQIAAGDRLRGQYQGLSADPNSLANLDQDLPNNMIHQVRIHSLPQEWLWCETWCDDASKANAKTIDLCNNPQTKEPKLDSAMRILPEWVEYDGEIRRILEGGTTKNDENRRDMDMRRQKGGDEHEEL